MGILILEKEHVNFFCFLLGTYEWSYLTCNAKFQAVYEVEKIWLEIVEVNVAEMTRDRY